MVSAQNTEQTGKGRNERLCLEDVVDIRVGRWQKIRLGSRRDALDFRLRSFFLIRQWDASEGLRTGFQSD